tara:strand:- start:11164 stop:11880 length:717 start_codon:yes stop_codon:yes gene_type:complete
MTKIQDLTLLESYLSKFNLPKVYVDIGCSNSFNISPERVKSSDITIFVEADKTKAKFYQKDEFNIKNFNIVNDYATPENILKILQPIGNKEIGFLDIDIDGYDYFVIKEILKKHKPKLMCCEINEKIPPPIKFTVFYDKDYAWDSSHFYGVSLSKLHELMEDYNLINLTGNNAYYLHNSVPYSDEIFTPEEAYKKLYNLNEFPWNSNVDHWRTLEPKEAVESIKEYFSNQKYRYEVYI